MKFKFYYKYVPKERFTRHPVFYQVIKHASPLLGIRDIGKNIISVFMNFISVVAWKSIMKIIKFINIFNEIDFLYQILMILSSFI